MAETQAMTVVEHTNVTALTSSNIKTQQQLAERMRQLQEVVFLVSPGTGGGVGVLSQGYEITPVVIVVDPSVDSETGRGADVYHQRSIHKGVGRGQDYRPVEVSLNHYGLLRVLDAVGVNVHETRWINDGSKDRYLWVCETDGDIIDFTGTLRRLPTGIGSLDARDGSPDIDEWTPEAWARAVDIANRQKEKTPPNDQWKVKPIAMRLDGITPCSWSADRVMQVRKYGRQLAKTKSLNGLARKLGVRQSYAIDELRRKPFVIMRPVFMPDYSDPEVRRMVTAAHLGARNLLYPGTTPHDAPVTHGVGEAGQTFSAEPVTAADPEQPERMQTAAPPTDAEEVNFDEPAPQQAQSQADEAYVVTRLLKKGDAYFIETQQGITLYTQDAGIAKACNAARKDGIQRVIQTERIMVNGQPYRAVVEVTAAGGFKL